MCVLGPHLVGNAGFGQAHELGKQCMRPARAAGQRLDQARDRSVAVSVERAQVNAIENDAGLRAQRRSLARIARGFAGLGAGSKRRSGVPRPLAHEHPPRAWR
jgi:hypothetical protein